MSFETNHGNVSYDYSELLGIIKEDKEDGTISDSSIIEILRTDDERLKKVGYRPIVDFYYPGTLKDLETPLEMLHNREEYSDSEWKALENERVKMLGQYNKDKPYLEVASVLAVITEMEQWNSILN